MHEKLVDSCLVILLAVEQAVKFYEELGCMELLW